jgi:tRNA dimethylallyltransferase
VSFKQAHLEYILKDIASKPTELIAIVGPTCTGKTDLSLTLAQELKIPVINADSRLIYAEMNIGTAKPTDEELSLASHYLVNIRKPNESYSAGDYRRDFDRVISNLEKAPSKAIVVGGTGLYLRSALENLEMPNISRDETLREELKTKNLEDLNALLNELDPQAHEHIDTQNKIRIIRAIEIIKHSGKALSENRSIAAENRYNTAFYGLNFHNRETLYELINKRVVRMMDQGLVAEVEALIKQYSVTQTMLATIGYKETIACLQGECSLDEAITLIQQRTRNYAKRQLTWFRSNSEIQWLYHD